MGAKPGSPRQFQFIRTATQARLDQPAFFQLNIERQSTDFVTEYFEADGRPSFEQVNTFDHRFVNLGASFDVVIFDVSIS